MDILRDLIQTIIVIVLLAVLVEMLLPGGDMRRYVKMVMGLLIIMAVMQAAAGVIKSDLVRDIPAVTGVDGGGAPSLEEIMAAGQELAEDDRELAVQQYSEALSGQVLSLARMNTELEAVDARVIIDGNAAIKEITLVFAAATGDGAPAGHSAGAEKRQSSQDAEGDFGIQPVVVDIKGEDWQSQEPPAVQVVTPEQYRSAAGQAQVVAEFYNLRPKQVKYEFREP